MLTEFYSFSFLLCFHALVMEALAIAPESRRLSTLEAEWSWDRV
jgi:hypothetical protein